MKPKIFLRKLLRGGNSIEDVFNMDSLSITDKGVDNTYVSKIDLTSDSFTFNEAYVNTYYLHLSIFCYYFVKQQNQDTDRVQFITDSVDKIKDYVKCFVLYKILKQIIDPSVLEDDKEKYINSIKSTDAFDQFDDKTIQGVSSKSSNLNNMKILLNAIAIIIKYSGDDNKTLIAALNNYCSNFHDLVTNEKKQTALNELLTKSQNAKATYEKSSKFLNKKMEIFEEIKREVKSKLDEYKTKFLTTMKEKDEYKLISQAKIAKVKKLAVAVIRVITKTSTSMYDTPSQIANVVKSSIDSNAEDGQLGKTEMGSLINEFNNLSQDEKKDKSMMVIQDLIDKKDDQSSLKFSTYYYEEYLKEEIVSPNQSTGGKKRRMKKKKGGANEEGVFTTLVSNFKNPVETTYIDHDSAQPELQVVLYDPLANSELKSKINAIQEPHDELIKVFNQNPANVTPLVAKEKEDRAKYDAIIKLVDSTDDSSVTLPQDLDKEKLIKMVKTIQMSDTIEKGEDLLIADIVGIDDELKSLAANIKSVSAIFKRLNDDDINGIIGGTVDEAALNQLKESVSKKLNMELTVYDKENNDNLKKKLDSYDAILKSATDITQLAQKIIEDHKTGGFRKLFYKKKRRGGDGEEAEPEDLDKPRIEDLETKYKNINQRIQDDIKKLGEDIEETQSFIAKYNQDSVDLTAVASTAETSQNSFMEQISKAKANRDEAIHTVTTTHDGIIADLNGKLESFIQDAADTRAKLTGDKEELIRKIKMKVTEIEKLKVLTGNMIDKAKKILDQKEKVIDTIITEKEQELRRIEKTIQNKEKKINEKMEVDNDIIARAALAQEQRINEVKNEQEQTNKLKAKKMKLANDLDDIKQTKITNTNEKKALDSKFEEYKQTLETSSKDNILKDYELKANEIENLNQLKFDLFTTQEDLEDPKTFLKETDVESLRNLANELLELNKPDIMTTGGGKNDISFKTIIGSDRYITSNIVIANKLYHVAKEAGINIQFHENGDLNEDNLTIDLLCDYLIIKLNNESISSPSIIKELLRKFQITDDKVTINPDNLSDLDNIQDSLDNIASYINDIYLIDDANHFVFGISLLIKYINEVFKKLAFSYSQTESSLSYEYNMIRNIDRTNDNSDIKTKIKKEVNDEYDKRVDQLNTLKQEISKIDKILEGNQGTTAAEVVPPSESSSPSIEAPITGGDYKKRRIEWFNKVYMRILKLKSYSKYEVLRDTFEALNGLLDDNAFSRRATNIVTNINHDNIYTKKLIIMTLPSGNRAKTNINDGTIGDIDFNPGTEVIVSFDSKKLIFYKGTDNTIKYVKYADNNNCVFLDLSKMNANFDLKEDDLLATKISILASDYGNDSDDKRAYRKTMLDWFNKVKRYIERRKDEDYTEINKIFAPLGETSNKLVFTQTLNELTSKGNLSKFDEDKKFYDALVVINTHTDNKAIKLKGKENDTDGELNGSSVVKITVTGSGSESESKTLEFITNNDKIKYVKFLAQGIYLKLTDIGMEFELKHGDENLIEISIDEPEDYSENIEATSEDKLYKIYKKYKGDVQNITQDTQLQSVLSSLRSTKTNTKKNYRQLATIYNKDEITFAFLDGNKITTLTGANLLDESKGEIFKLNYRGNNTFIGQRETHGTIRILYIKLNKDLYANIEGILYNETTPQLTGGAPNTDKPNNIFNAYIIMVMNKIMEMDEADLKDFTNKAQIAPAQA